MAEVKTLGIEAEAQQPKPILGLSTECGKYTAAPSKQKNKIKTRKNNKLSKD